MVLTDSVFCKCCSHVNQQELLTKIPCGIFLLVLALFVASSSRY